jgi:hypothetical protein
MATLNLVNAFSEAVAEKVHNLGSDVIKVMFSNTLPTVSNSIKTDITEISAGGGYSAGGFTVTITSSAQTSGVYRLIASDLSFTASGAVATFQYVVLYNDTAASKNLIGWYAYPSAITMATGENFTIDFDNTNGILSIT